MKRMTTAAGRPNTRAAPKVLGSSAATPSEAIDHVAPLGKVYLPDGSYREMTEWALPVEQQVEYDRVTHDLEHDERWPRIKRFVRGGFWRNFKVKYPGHNLRRALVQFRLTESIEAHEADIRHIIGKMVELEKQSGKSVN